MSRALTVASALLLFAAPEALAQDTSQLADMEAVIPPGYEQVTSFVEGRGTIYARSTDLTAGDPTYGVSKGKVIAIEYSFRPEDFEARKTWPEFRGLAGLSPVDHMRIDYEPNGHGPVSSPLYVLRIFFLPEDEIAMLRE